MSAGLWLIHAPSRRVPRLSGCVMYTVALGFGILGRVVSVVRITRTVCMMALAPRRSLDASTELSVVCLVGLEVVKISFSMRLGAVSGNRVSRE